MTGTVATLTQPYAATGLTTVALFPTLVEDNSWAITNVLQVYTLPLLNLKVLTPSGGDSNAGFTAPICWVQNVKIPDVSGTPGNSAFPVNADGCGIALMSCSVDPYTLGVMPAVGGGGGFFVNCFLNGSGAFLGNESSFCNIIGGSINTSTNEPMYCASGVVIVGDCILHGTIGGSSPNVSVTGGFNYVQKSDRSRLSAWLHATAESSSCKTSTGTVLV